MIDITIEEIFDRLFNELKTEFIGVEKRLDTSNGIEIAVLQQVITKHNLKFTKYKTLQGYYEFEIKTDKESLYYGLYSEKVKEEYNLEEAKLLKSLWDRLEDYYNFRKKENISNKYEKLCKALKGK